MNKRKKLAIVKKIDSLLASIGKPKSNYDLIVDGLSHNQLDYYLGLTEEDVFYTLELEDKEATEQLLSDSK